jgi:hypothetical protein
VKTFAALAAAGLIAGAGVLWFFTNPVVVTATVKPLQPSSEIPTFKRATDGAPTRQDVRPSH